MPLSPTLKQVAATLFARNGRVQIKVLDEITSTVRPELVEGLF